MSEDWETACPKREDGQHCNCWYDGSPCCACGATDILDGRAKEPCPVVDTGAKG